MTAVPDQPAAPDGQALDAALNHLDTPALLVDVGRLERNIDAMTELLAGRGVTLRPHVKASKCWEVARRQLIAGAIGFTCATVAEVGWLRQQGVSDLLWAHQPVGPAKVAFAVAAAAEGGLMVTLDSVAAAGPLAEAAAGAGVTVPYLLEVDTGLGRAGVQPETAVTRAKELGALPGLALRGVVTHEGHLAQYGSDRAAVERAGRAAGDLLAQVASALRSDGHPAEIVSVGSTPGATSAPFASGVTEARPGTYVYYDANQVRLGSAALADCAQTVLSRVVSAERSGTVITDAGVKAMSSDTIAAAGSFGLVCDLDCQPLPGVEFSGGYEEHGCLTGPGVAQLSVGDLVRIVPNHACGTTNMFSQLYAVRAGTATEIWPISARY
jgi:D-serine deaminase-like pyridoxal phosphate-dependent protein